MSGRKRPSARTASPSSSSSSYGSSSSSYEAKKRKRQISLSTFKNWKSKYDEELQTLTWLDCDRDKGEVDALWCSACRAYKGAIYGMKNYSEAWIAGSQNQRVSNVVDHGNSEQHKVAMCRYRQAQAKSSSQPVTSYAPIAKSLLNLGDTDKARLRRKFDICYMMAKEGMAFEKFAAIYELEQRHDVELGT